MLCSDKTLFANTGQGSNLFPRQCFPTHNLEGGKNHVESEMVSFNKLKAIASMKSNNLSSHQGFLSIISLKIVDPETDAGFSHC